jgi:hypothetical protein
MILDGGLGMILFYIIQLLYIEGNLFLIKLIRLKAGPVSLILDAAMVY